MDRVPVYIHADDPICRAGLSSQLRPRPEVLVLAEEERYRAQVGLVVTDVVDDNALNALRTLRCASVPRLVLIAGRIDDADLTVVTEIGVSGVLRRAEASADRLVSVIAAAAAGEGAIPPDLLGRLLAQVGQLQRQVLSPRGLTLGGLAEREVEVLRLVAEGLDTDEIASKLAYSARTIKNILYGLTSRLQLRNRAHAVAYALRNGLI